MNTVSSDIVATAAYAADMGPNVIRTDYSGRGMYGDTCLAVEAPSEKVFPFLAELTLALTEDDELDGPETARELARAAKTDSMGYDRVLYFPGWSLTDG